MRTAAVLAAALALGAAGCSGSDPEPDAEPPPVQPPTGATTTTPIPAPADTAYARDLDRLCRRMLAAHAKVGRSTTTGELARHFPKTAAIDRRFARDIVAVAPPKGRESEAGRLAGLFTAISRSQDTALGFLQTNSINGYFQHMEAALETRRQAERLARRLGVPACAVRPRNL